MELSLRLTNPPLADGDYRITAKGFMAASLFLADERGPLPDWTALAHLPLDVSGRANFHYMGGRAIPPEATHVAARVISADFSRQETILAPLPGDARPASFVPAVTFAVMSDLHTAAKPGRIRRALTMASGADCVLLPGDLTNDGTPEQFDCLWQLLEETLPRVPVLAVGGNHDMTLHPLPLVRQVPLRDENEVFIAVDGSAVECAVNGRWISARIYPQNP